MFEIHKESGDDGLMRDVWEVIVGMSGDGSTSIVHCQMVGFRREVRPSPQSKKWVTVEFWSPCMGEGCRMPLVPRGAAPARPLKAFPKLSDAEVLQHVQARMKVRWSGEPEA